MRFCIPIIIALFGWHGYAQEPTTFAEFTFTESFGITWPECMVTQPVQFNSGTARASRLRLLNTDGEPVPFQLSSEVEADDGTLRSAQVSFRAGVEAGESLTYRLVEGATEAPPTSLRVTADDAALMLSSDWAGIRLPPAGEQRFAEPPAWGGDHGEQVAAYGEQQAAGWIPGPLQAFRLPDGSWAGGSYFWAASPEHALKLERLQCEVTAQGPLFIEARVTYIFEGKGWYRLTARLIEGETMVRIDEAYDFGHIDPQWQRRMVFSLTSGWREDGWRPDLAFGASPDGRIKEQSEAFKARLEAADFTPAGRVFSMDLSYEEAASKITDIAPWYPWHPNAYYLGLTRLDEMATCVGVVPLDAGAWRGDSAVTAGMLFTHATGDVSLQWNLTALPHPGNLLHTGEYDPQLPLTHVRRRWALVTAPFAYEAPLRAIRNHTGYLTLSDAMRWQTIWSRDPEARWPRLVINRAEADEIRQQLAQHPMQEHLKTQLIFNDSAEGAAALWKKVQHPSEWSGPLGQLLQVLRKGASNDGQWFMMHFRQAQMAGWAPAVDELLSSQHLSDEQREELLSQIAALCHALAEPNANPRGNMVHLGNPNMPINRFMALPFAAALIPDHPMANLWLNTSREYLRYKLAMNTAPGGAWSELISYFGASAPHLMQGAMVLERTGRMDDATAQLATMPANFTLQLLTPADPRFGARTVPGWGHEGAVENTHWMPAAALMRNRDRAMAEAFAWAWDQCGRPMKSHHDAGFTPYAVVHADLLNDLPEGYVPESFRSTWFPGVGAVLRDRPGTPEESYLSLRNGYMVSHSDANQGDFTWYAKGAPLVTLSLHAYPLHQLKGVQEIEQSFGWHSVPRVGRQDQARSWPGGGAYGGIPSHSFSDSIDYLRAWGDYDTTRWTRQMMMVKGQSAEQTTYLVLRDSFEPLAGDAQPTWWNLRTLGSKEQVTPLPNGFRYRSEFGVEMDVVFPGLTDVQVESRDVTYEGPLYFGSAQTWLAAGSPVVKKQHADNIQISETLTVTSVGPIPAGDDVIVVLYPRRPDEALPTIASLADGLIRVTTDAGTDHLFLAPAESRATHGDLAFAGTAGAVREFGDQVQYVVAEGGTTAGWKGGTIGNLNPRPIVHTVARAMAEKRQLPIGDPVPIAASSSHTDEAGVIHVQLSGAASETQGDVIAATTGAAHGSGLVTLQIHPDRIVGTSSGLGRLLYVSKPKGLDRLPVLLIDGQSYAPGVSGDTLIIPLLPGDHDFELRAIEQPPIFRDWELWDMEK